jgi:hypothetical protein
MKIHLIKYFFASLFCMIVFVACDDDPDETMSWKPGTGLHIVGSGDMAVGEESEFYVDGFTVKENYTWTLDDAQITPIRQGEFVVLNFDEPGTHTLTVTNGKYSGSLDINVEE